MLRVNVTIENVAFSTLLVLLNENSHNDFFSVGVIFNTYYT